MLKLLYDIRCGFKELYMTERNCKFDLDFLTDQDNSEPDMYVPTENELLADLRGLDQAGLEECYI